MNQKVFFCGIGGIGMSALAISALKKNFIVSGSDKDLSTEVIFNLLSFNIKIISQELVREEDIILNDYIVFTNAISSDNIIYKYAKKANKKILLRNEFLNFFLKDKKIIAISGSHGKTTTTSIIGFLLKEADMDPSIYVGGIMQQYGTNVIQGNSDLVVLEADDAYRSFLSVNPYVSIVTSISPEHFETYKDIEDIKNAFLQFMNNTVDHGIIIVNKDNNFINELIKKINDKKIISYGKNPGSDYRIAEITLKKKYTYFELFFEEKIIQKFKIPLFGEYNVFNAVAAFIVSHSLGLSFSILNKKIKYFRGVQRRFHYRGLWNGFQVYDDYAHHPNEINSLFTMIRLKKKKVCIFFQPHKYVRLEKLWEDFLEVFKKNSDLISFLFITEVYGVGEDTHILYNSKALVFFLKSFIKNIYLINYDHDKNITLNTFKNYFHFMKNKEKKKTIILTLGAGLMNRLFP